MAQDPEAAPYEKHQLTEVRASVQAASHHGEIHEPGARAQLRCEQTRLEVLTRSRKRMYLVPSSL